MIKLALQANSTYQVRLSGGIDGLAFSRSFGVCTGP